MGGVAILLLSSCCGPARTGDPVRDPAVVEGLDEISVRWTSPHAYAGTVVATRGGTLVDALEAEARTVHDVRFPRARIGSGSCRLEIRPPPPGEPVRLDVSLDPVARELPLARRLDRARIAFPAAAGVQVLEAELRTAPGTPASSGISSDRSSPGSDRQEPGHPADSSGVLTGSSSPASDQQAPAGLAGSPKGAPTRPLSVDADGVLSGLAPRTAGVLHLRLTDRLGRETRLSLDLPARDLATLTRILDTANRGEWSRAEELASRLCRLDNKRRRPRAGDDVRLEEESFAGARAQLLAALSREPPGGLAALLEDAALQLDAEPSAEVISSFLEALRPRLDLESRAALDGLTSAAQAHDFLNGLGPFARRRAVLIQQPIAGVAALLEGVSLPGHGRLDGATAYELLDSRPENCPAHKLDFDRPGEWIRMRMIGSFMPDLTARSRYLARERWDRRTPVEAPFLARYLRGTLTEAFELAGAPRDGALQIAFLCKDFQKFFRLEVSIDDRVRVPFRFHPLGRAGPDAETWLSLALPLPTFSAAAGPRRLTVELRMLPGEVDRLDNYAADSCSTGNVAILIRALAEKTASPGARR